MLLNFAFFAKKKEGNGNSQLNDPVLWKPGQIIG